MAKQNALELYASDLQRKLDGVKVENEEKNKILKELNQKDWVKTIQQNNVILKKFCYFFFLFKFFKQEISSLRKIIVNKDYEIQEIKKQYKNLLHNNNRTINYK